MSENYQNQIQGGANDQVPEGRQPADVQQPTNQPPIYGQPAQGYYQYPSQPQQPYQYPYYQSGYPIYPTNPYYYNPQLAREEYEKRLKVEKAKKSLRYLGNMSGVSILLFLLVNTLVSTVLVIPSVSKLYASDAAFSSAFSIIASFLYIFIPFSVTALLIRIKDKQVNFFPFKKMKPKRALLCIPIGLTVCVAANVITNYLITLLDGLGVKLSQQSDSMAQPQSAAALFIALISTALMPALLEEYALRGVILQPLRRYGMLFAILSSSAIFGIMHGNLIQAPFAFMVGMCFAFFAIKCDSLWIGVILHMINNGFSVIISFAADRVAETTLNLIYYIIVGAVVLAGIACFVVLLLTDKEFFSSGEGNIAGEEAKILSAGQKFTAFFINAPMIISFVIMLLLTAQFVSR